MKKLLLGLGLILSLTTFCPHGSQAVVTNQATQTISAHGNSVTTNVTLSFDFRDNSQLLVYLVETSSGTNVKTLISFGSGAGKYTLTGGNPATTVVMGTAWTSTQYIEVDRSIPLIQPVAYDESSAFPAADMATQMDQMVMMIQGLNTQVSTIGASSLPSLPTANIYLGNSVGQAVAAALSGDLSINSGGVVTIGTSAITGSKIADGTITVGKIAAGVIPATSPPTVQKFLTGSGTYTRPTPAPLYLEFEAVGGGGGGGSSGTGSNNGGGNGGSTFLGSLVTCNGGSGAPVAGATTVIGGAGGSATLAGGALGFALSGGSGGAGGDPDSSASYPPSGAGGVSALGGAAGSTAGARSANGSVGVAAAANSGSGGSGGSAANSTSDFIGGGGGAGGYARGIITSPATTYSYGIGAAGTAGSAGTGGNAGGVGASGILVIIEHYQ